MGTSVLVAFITLAFVAEKKGESDHAIALEPRVQMCNRHGIR